MIIRSKSKKVHFSSYDTHLEAYLAVGIGKLAVYQESREVRIHATKCRKSLSDCAARFLWTDFSYLYWTDVNYKSKTPSRRYFRASFESYECLTDFYYTYRKWYSQCKQSKPSEVAFSMLSAECKSIKNTASVISMSECSWRSRSYTAFLPKKEKYEKEAYNGDKRKPSMICSSENFMEFKSLIHRCPNCKGLKEKKTSKKSAMYADSVWESPSYNSEEKKYLKSSKKSQRDNKERNDFLSTRFHKNLEISKYASNAAQKSYSAMYILPEKETFTSDSSQSNKSFYAMSIPLEKEMLTSKSKYTKRRENTDVEIEKKTHDPQSQCNLGSYDTFDYDWQSMKNPLEVVYNIEESSESTWKSMKNVCKGSKSSLENAENAFRILGTVMEKAEIAKDSEFTLENAGVPIRKDTDLEDVEVSIDKDTALKDEVPIDKDTALEDVYVTIDKNIVLEEAYVPIYNETALESADVLIEKDTGLENEGLMIDKDTALEDSDILIDKDTVLEDSNVLIHMDTAMEAADILKDKDTVLEDSNVLIYMNAVVEDADILKDKDTALDNDVTKDKDTPLVDEELPKARNNSLEYVDVLKDKETVLKYKATTLELTKNMMKNIGKNTRNTLKDKKNTTAKYDCEEKYFSSSSFEENTETESTVTSSYDSESILSSSTHCTNESEDETKIARASKAEKDEENGTTIPNIEDVATCNYINFPPNNKILPMCSLTANVAYPYKDHACSKFETYESCGLHSAQFFSSFASLQVNATNDKNTIKMTVPMLNNKSFLTPLENTFSFWPLILQNDTTIKNIPCCKREHRENASFPDGDIIANMLKDNYRICENETKHTCPKTHDIVQDNWRFGTAFPRDMHGKDSDEAVAANVLMDFHRICENEAIENKDDWFMINKYNEGNCMSGTQYSSDIYEKYSDDEVIDNLLKDFYRICGNETKYICPMIHGFVEDNLRPGSSFPTDVYGKDSADEVIANLLKNCHRIWENDTNENKGIGPMMDIFTEESNSRFGPSFPDDYVKDSDDQVIVDMSKDYHTVCANEMKNVLPTMHGFADDNWSPGTPFSNDLSGKDSDDGVIANPWKDFYRTRVNNTWDICPMMHDFADDNWRPGTPFPSDMCGKDSDDESFANLLMDFHRICKTEIKESEGAWLMMNGCIEDNCRASTTFPDDLHGKDSDDESFANLLKDFYRICVNETEQYKDIWLMRYDFVKDDFRYSTPVSYGMQWNTRNTQSDNWIKNNEDEFYKFSDFELPDYKGLFTEPGMESTVLLCETDADILVEEIQRNTTDFNKEANYQFRSSFDEMFSSFATTSFTNSNWASCNSLVSFFASDTGSLVLEKHKDENQKFGSFSSDTLCSFAGTVFESKNDVSCFTDYEETAFIQTITDETQSLLPLKIKTIFSEDFSDIFATSEQKNSCYLPLQKKSMLDRKIGDNDKITETDKQEKNFHDSYRFIKRNITGNGPLNQILNPRADVGGNYNVIRRRKYLKDKSVQKVIYYYSTQGYVTNLIIRIILNILLFWPWSLVCGVFHGLWKILEICLLWHIPLHQLSDNPDCMDDNELNID